MVGMSMAPVDERESRIKAARGRYRVASIITGVLLLLLVAEMLLKYLFHLEVELGGPFGAVALTPEETLTGFNASRAILIVHGWFYVVYLLASYMFWSRMRWPFRHFLLMAAAGVVPFLSFILEHHYVRRSRSEVAEAARERAEWSREDAELRRLEASLSDEERARLDREVAEEAARRRSTSQ